MPFRIRDAGPADGRFLTEMLVEAVNWSRSGQRPRVELLADRQVMRYIAGWPKPGDFGSIAEAADGTPIGGCWARLFPGNDPGYGTVAVGVPEITLGVRPVWRAQGVGRALLQRVLGQARAAGCARISLSVSHGNYAARLYRSEGFVVVGGSGTAETMVRTLR